MSSDTLSTVYDHYKDTCALIGDASRRRDRLLLWSLGVMVLLGFEIFFPTPAERLFSSFLARQISIEEPIDVGLVGNVIWIALLVFAVRYYQTVAYVERLYPYLHRLEERVNETLGKEHITREGKSYLADYPKFQSWLAFLYQRAVPLILFVLPTIRIAMEIWRGQPTVSLFIDITVYALFAWSTLRYVDMIHVCKKNQPGETVEQS